MLGDHGEHFGLDELPVKVFFLRDRNEVLTIEDSIDTVNLEQLTSKGRGISVAD